MTDIIIVALSKLDADPMNVRKSYSAEGIEALAANIRADGYRLLQKAVVRNGDKGGPLFRRRGRTPIGCAQSVGRGGRDRQGLAPRVQGTRRGDRHGSQPRREARYALSAAAELSAPVLDRIGSRIERVSEFVEAAGKGSSGMLRRATAILEWLVKRLMHLPRRSAEVSETNNMTWAHVENGMHTQITSPHPFDESNQERRSANAEQLSSPKAGSASKWAFEESLRRGRSEFNQPRRLPQAMVALQDVIRAVPALKTYGFAPSSWADLTRAVPLMCRFAGISEDARARAVEQMGEQQAAVAVAATLEKYDRQEVSSLGGYLRAMTDRARAGELHLARSVFGLAARNSMEVRH